MSFTKKRKVILIIRDGWGYRESKIDNTIKKADTPIDDALRENLSLIHISALDLIDFIPNVIKNNFKENEQSI